MPHLRRAGIVLVLASLLVVGFATLLPEDGNPIPSFCIICGTLGGVDAILNILLFVPLGVGLSLSSVRARIAIPAMFMLSLSIEVTQLVAIPGRDASLGDLLTDSAGGAFGFALARYAAGWLRPSTRNARRLAIVWCGLWIGIQTAASFGFAPALPASQYYGQIGRPLEIFAKFDGRILDAMVGDQKVPDWGFPNSAETRQRLNEHASVVVTVIPAEPTQDLAPIIRIADDEKREILVLAQDRRSLVFGIRTGAAVLRLRQPLFALRELFPDSNARSARAQNDTIRVEGRYAATHVELRGYESSKRVARRLRIGSAMGWTLVAPTQWYIDGRTIELVVTWLWSYLLILPLGYWMRYALRTHHGRFQQSALLSTAGVGLGVLTLGLIFIPHAYGLSAAVFGDWLAVIAGIATGWFLGRLGAGTPEPRARFEHRL